MAEQHHRLATSRQTGHNPLMTTYKKAAERRWLILQVACKLAEKTHYSKVRRHHLVKPCGTAAGNISRIMGSMEEMRTAVIEYALVNDRNIIIAQAIIDKHPSVADLEPFDRARVLGAMV